MPLGSLPRRRILLWTGRSLFAAALAVLLFRLDDGSVPRDPLFHPEAVYPAALYADLDNWARWTTPFAPYFVPDVALFFLCAWAAGDPVAATYAYGALQFTLLVAAFGALSAGVVRDGSLRGPAVRYATLAGAWIAVLSAMNVHGSKTFLQLFVAAFHTGSFVLAVAGLAIVVAILNTTPGAPRGRETGLASLLFLVTLLGVLSDRLLLAVFVVPAILALLLRAGRFAAPARTVRIVFAAAAGASLGYAALDWINAADVIRIQRFPALDAARYLDSLRALWSTPELLYVVSSRFFGRLGWVYRAFWLLWLLTTVALASSLTSSSFRSSRLAPSSLQKSPPSPRGALQALDAASRRNLGLVTLFWLLSFAVTTLATHFTVMAVHDARLESPTILFIDRYLVSLFVTPFFASALYVAVAPGRRWVARLEVLQVAVLAVLVASLAFRLDLGRPFPSYRPHGVDCLDEELSERDAQRGPEPRHGLAHFYYHARTLNLFSRRGLHVDQVTRDLAAVAWIANRDRAGETTGYHFVVTNRLDEKAILERLGPPGREIRCGDWEVFVYDEPVFLSPAEERPRSVSTTETNRQTAPKGTSNTASPGSPP